MASHQLTAKKSCDASEISWHIRVEDKVWFIKAGLKHVCITLSIVSCCGNVLFRGRTNN
jgi:hypothetical protein